MVQVPDTLRAEEDQVSTAEDTESSISSIDTALAAEMQLAAQSIVFSFLQKKLNKDKMKSRFVPAISITLQNYQLMCYDSEQDILVSTIADSADTKLFDDTIKSLNYTSVVVLWMALNYRLLCSGVPHSQKIRLPDVKAGFFDRVGDHLYLYEDEVQRPAHAKPSKKVSDAPAGQGKSMQQMLGDHTTDIKFQPLL